MVEERCWHCEPSKAERRYLDSEVRCPRCAGKYTPARVKALLAAVRRCQDHGIRRESDAVLAAEASHVNDVLLGLVRTGRMKDPAYSALVGCCMLSMTHEDVAVKSGVSRPVISVAIGHGLDILCDALNGPRSPA